MALFHVAAKQCAFGIGSVNKGNDNRPITRSACFFEDMLCVHIARGAGGVVRFCCHFLGLVMHAVFLIVWRRLESGVEQGGLRAR